MDCDYDLNLSGNAQYLEEAMNLESQEDAPTQTNSAKKRRKRTENFTTEDKKRLAFEIKKNPVIWDLADAQHFNINAVNLAWRKISSTLQKSIEECKAAWTSLKESQRYQKTKLKKSGSSGGVPIPEPHDIDWEFSEDLSFLPVTSKKRKTFSTAIPVSGSAENDSSSSSNYSYLKSSSTSVSINAWEVGNVNRSQRPRINSLQR